MKISLVEVGHWHARMYIEALRDYGADVVAVSDKNIDVAERVAAYLGCNHYLDYRDLIASERVDFAFAFGKHFEMPAIAKTLIDACIDFAIEKPLGIDFHQVERLAKSAEKKELFVAIPFVFRMAPWVQRLTTQRNEGEIDEFAHLYFRYIAGPPSRYVKWGCEWMLDKKQAGGGCTINLGVHFIDLFQYITRGEIKWVFARISNKVHKKEIEDFSMLVLENSDGTLGIVETGYAHPFTKPEWQYLIIGSRNYFVIDEDSMKQRNEDGEKIIPNPSGVNLYAQFVKDTLNRFKTGREPIAGIRDMLNTLRIVNLAYASSSSQTPIRLGT